MKSRLSLIAAVVGLMVAPLPSFGRQASIVIGVSQVSATGDPGPVYASSEAWVPIVGGDDSTSFPNTFLMVRECGAGRVAMVGHDGVFRRVDVLDNQRLLTNTIEWLRNSRSPAVRYSSGHGEWLGADGMQGLGAALQSNGLSWASLPAPISAAGLHGVGVLIVGNAWGALSDLEIDAIRQWVLGGGGLFLVGVGWSWVAYHPDTTIDDYPMSRLGAVFGGRWLQAVIRGTAQTFNGSPVFTRFYPDLPGDSVASAVASLRALHGAHGLNLRDTLEVHLAVRRRYQHAHQLFAIIAAELPPSHPDRAAMFEAALQLMRDYPVEYARLGVIDRATHPNSAWGRERLWLSCVDALPVTPDRRALLVSTGRLSGLQRRLLELHGVAVLDNASLDTAQFQYLDDLLSAVPPDLHDLRAITVQEYWGDRPAGFTPIAGSSVVNISGLRIGQAAENGFPSDVPPFHTDVFCVVAAHELNHIVDVFTIGGDPVRRARRDALIARAGTEPLNYLRSVIPPGFFTQNPQEFFASIANQWFANSEHTLALGLRRFSIGRPEPLSQALFFADTYSRGTTGSWFYSTTTSGVLTARTSPLRRDLLGRINSITSGGKRYEFTLSGAGDVTAVAEYCLADFDSSGGPSDVADLFAFLVAWFSEHPWSDIDGNGYATVQDIFEFLSDYFGPC